MAASEKQAHVMRALAECLDPVPDNEAELLAHIHKYPASYRSELLALSRLASTLQRFAENPGPSQK